MVSRECKSSPHRNNSDPESSKIPATVEVIMREMSEARTKECRELCGCGSKPLDSNFHFRRLEIIKTIKMMGGVCQTGMMTGACGEMMEIYLGTELGRIIEANFLTNGCHFSIFSGYVASKLAIGKTADEALEINADGILRGLGQTPENKLYCAHLAAEALHAAIRRWIYSEEGHHGPWR